MADPKDPPPEPSFGPDEEGEIDLPPDAVSDEAQAWVHVERPATPPPPD